MDLRAQATHPEAARTELLATHILALRAQGLSYRRIGERVGLSHAQAHRITVERLSEIRTANSESAEELRTLELHRLDDMWRRAYPLNDEERLEPQRLRALIRLSESRRSLLGLDIQPKIGVPPIVPYAGPFDLERLSIAELRELEKIAMRASGLDPTMEVFAVQPLRGESAAATIEPVKHETAEPVAVATIETVRGTSGYVPE